MTKQQFIQKITSRKFIVSFLTQLAGLITLIFGESSLVNSLLGCALTVVPTIVYCLVEGRIDCENAKKIVDSVVETVEEIKDQKHEILKG